MKLQIVFHVALLVVAFIHQGASAQDSQGICPIINVSTVEPASTGATLIYKANIQSGDSLVTPKFTWTVSAGKITSGQGTSEVTVDPEGANSITVTVEVTGYASSCPNKAAYTWVADRVMSRKFDEYRNLKFSEERLRLDQFAIALHNEPDAKGYIIVYDARHTRKPVAQARGERAKNYLINKRQVQGRQIVIVNGGRREQPSVELFITPRRALPPTPTPN